MQRKSILALLLTILLVVPQMVWAAQSGKITQANFYVYNTGAEQKLRLVLDVSQPVEAAAVSNKNGSSELVVKVKGAARGRLRTLPLDGKFASVAKFSKLDDDSSLVSIKLPRKLSDADYSVFTLPSDAAANRPFRVVIDIFKPGGGGNGSAAIQTMPGKPGATAGNTNVRLTAASFAVHTDAATGSQKLRLVVESTGQVQPAVSFVSSPQPQLVVNLKGAALGSLPQSLALDGSIASVAKFVRSDDKNSQMLIQLPALVEQNDYQVFTLPSDAKAGRPFRVVVDINKQLAPVEFNFAPGLKGKVIVLDAGHGGSDPGAIGLNGTQEKTVALAVTQRVRSLLEKAGAKVVMTRTDDRDVFSASASAAEELGARVKVANSINADLFLSIHANSFGTRTVGGTSTHFYLKSRYDKLLSESIQANVVKAIGLNDRGVQPANFYVVKRTLMPAALLEMAFISNPNEEKLLISPQFQQKVAQAVVDGIDDFFLKAARKGGGQ